MKRRAFGTTLPEPLSSDFISFCVKNGYKYAEALREGIRRLLTPVPQYIQQSQSLPRLKRPPLPPKQQTAKGLMIKELKEVLNGGTFKFQEYIHIPPEDLRKRELLKEERMADEVGIK